jgi:hypothetical protein
MPIDDVRPALVTLLSQPVAVASVIVLAGINAAIWLLVLERAGFPPVLAWLLLVPPLTLLLPLYVALARWPGERRVRVPRRNSDRRFVKRVAKPQRLFTRRPVLSFHLRGPLRLDEDGMPRVRIPLEPAPIAPGLPALSEALARHLHSRAS